MTTKTIAALAGTLVLASFVPHAAPNVAARSASPALSAWLPTGQTITPLAAPGAMRQPLRTGLRADGSADAGGAMAVALDPAGDTLLVLTSGYNYQYDDPSGRKIRFPVRNPITGMPSRVSSDLTQWIFVYHVRDGNLEFSQHIPVPDTFIGLAWAPDGTRFYVSGGIDDRVLVFRRHDTAFAYDAPAILLGHNHHNADPLPDYDGGILAHTKAGARGKDLGLGFSALAAGLAVSADGRTLAVANMQNDSLSIADSATRHVTREVRLFRPGSLRAHGEYPYGVAILPRTAGGRTQKIYVTSLRDGDVAVIAKSAAPGFIGLGGEPNALLPDASGTHLYVANGDLDEVDVIDTATDRLERRIGVDRPNQRYGGANPNGLTLSADGRRLYVSLGGENAVAVVDLPSGAVVGRIPTGWYPTALARYGDRLVVADAKSPSGPNPHLDTNVAMVGSRLPNLQHRDEYVLDLEKADILSFPVPSDSTLADLSRTVDTNNGFNRGGGGDATMAMLHTKIKHVIFIMKENRTYDQVLGDLSNGANGDSRLTSFPYAIAPNHHELARRFVTLDDFYTSGDVSADGWNWSLQARANEYTTRSTPIAYASSGFSGDWNGNNRGLNLALPDTGGHDPFNARATTLLDPSGSSSVLPGSKDVAANAGDGDENAGASGGFLWDAVLRSGLSVRHYGMYADATYYAKGAPFYIPIVREAYSRRARQAAPVRPALADRTDPYYRGWDLNTPDRYRYEEWKREFAGYVRNDNLPSFEAVCLMMDHFGQFASNVGGLNTPYLQMSDDDYALGLLVAEVTHSPYWKDTAIFVLEDDAQDGPDHVDSHRSPAFVISAYTRRGAVVHARYTTVGMLATIEDILGTGHLSMFDANASPMSDAFGGQADLDPYVAILPGDLCRPPVKRDLIPECRSSTPRTANRLPRKGAHWWIAQTRRMNFERPDAIDPRRFNRLLETGL
jgi:YVTN family beta-propeller protein